MSEAKAQKPDEKLSLTRRFLESVLQLLRFFSRLPVFEFAFERAPHGLPDARLAAPAMTIAALFIALPAALAMGLAHWLGAPPAVAAVLGLAALAAASGGLHEDGLADTIDAFSAGGPRERMLEVMRDSRIGAHGALAIIISFVLQAAALSAIATSGGLWAALAALICAAMLSRVLCLAPLALLEPARKDGRGASFGQPPLLSLVVGIVIAVDVLILAALVTSLTLYGALIGSLLALAAVRAVIVMAEKHIGGQTGDICGACQQAAAAAALLGFSLR